MTKKESMTDIRLELSAAGIPECGRVLWNSKRDVLYQETESRSLGVRTACGALVCETGRFTGRAPRDRFFVRGSPSEERIGWGKINRPFPDGAFGPLKTRQLNYLSGRDIFVEDCWVGADPNHRIGLRVITDSPWHALFARNMFLAVDGGTEGGADRGKFQPEYQLIHTPEFEAEPARDRTNSEAFIVLDFEGREILIGGTHYAGEIKKAMFTVMNYLLPERGILPMHCSANVGKVAGDVAVFFGLSGTGKTTLSTDNSRFLIGDDEHAWGDSGVFNFEGGCYAKVIDLSREAEPQIYAATSMYGTILENVVLDETGGVDYSNRSLTENTRASYPLEFIDGAVIPSIGGHPGNVFMLTCDAFGVLPPISRLTLDQARFWFLSGYTAKIAGTEAGITEPSVTFSTCFGAPFLPRPPAVYANLLVEKVRQHGACVWLVNTGWSGGAYGKGQRVKIAFTRAMVNAALAGGLSTAPFQTEGSFGLAIPRECHGIPVEILEPRRAWADPAAYDNTAGKLSEMLRENFDENFG